ncbi:hypothetical protein [Phytohabitans houttuyneae]|uniref:Uncharacterized protein n=1 Tax=Phytohabitans houttuyneae TaxID=1076126 RepID=A0A6V8K2X9_9ACTN|nr:hypothetical protein [Phytohabitans houttuyneae]GFJ79502.1 hypothetical protein Phou_036820 [Phytohabitans houttuyneae]
MPRNTQGHPIEPAVSFERLIAAGPLCPVDCDCHTGGLDTPCSVPGGCGSHGCGTANTGNTAAAPHARTASANASDVDQFGDVARFCASPEREDGRPTCRSYDYVGKHPGIVSDDTRWSPDLFCPPCTAGYERDVRMLPFDWLDLEQMQLPMLSQALDTQRSVRPGPPMPLAGNPEALQAEIRHVLLTWETQMRILQRAQRRTTLIVGAWHTTKSNPPPPARTLPGRDVQRAAGFLAARIPDLSRLPATPVRPAGITDPVAELTGVDAVVALADLHRRSRSLLGRTHRTTTVPGSCSTCGWALWRDEPRYEGDPCDIYCSNPAGCESRWTYDEYERYVGLELAYPRRRAAAEVGEDA